MARTITVDTGDELRGFVEGLVESGHYKTNSEVIREGLRLLQEQQAKSKLQQLKQLINEGDNSGDAIDWDKKAFLNNMEINAEKKRSD